MKFKDFEKVQKLKVKLQKLDNAFVEAGNLHNKYEEEEDGVWCCCISEYTDGSGQHIDLRGCYLGKKVASSTLILIEEEIEITKLEMISLGVAFENGTEGDTYEK